MLCFLFALPIGGAFLFWKLLIDKDVKKKELCEKGGISPSSLIQMGRYGHATAEVQTDILPL